MSKFPEGYLAFEIEHTAALEDLWRKTGDETIRALILSARAVLRHHWDSQKIATKKMSDFEKLRQVFPEIPERTKALTINMVHDSYPEIDITFYPKN